MDVPSQTVRHHQGMEEEYMHNLQLQLRNLHSPPSHSLRALRVDTVVESTSMLNHISVPLLSTSLLSPSLHVVTLEPPLGMGMESSFMHPHSLHFLPSLGGR